MIRAACLSLLLALPLTAEAACRQALALGLDVSGSVDEREYRLQLDGLAQAFSAPMVRDRLLAMPDAPVRILIYEWSGPGDQRILAPWSEMADDVDVAILIELLRQKVRTESSPGTALGLAMMAGADFLDQQSQCWKRTLDLSGDGKSNLGPRPREVKPALARRGITINGLVIGVDDPQIGDTRQAEIAELSSYYRAEVIVGPEAFVQTALGYEDYARAMEIKLLRELEGLVLSMAD